MGSTASGLRYPASTEAVTNGALAIEHLAEDVEAQLHDGTHALQPGGVNTPGAVTTQGGIYNSGPEVVLLGNGAAARRARISDDATHVYVQADEAVVFTAIFSADWRVRHGKPSDAADVPLSARAAAGQSVDVQQWQDNGGTVYAKVDKDFSIHAWTSLQMDGHANDHLAVRFNRDGVDSGAIAVTGLAGSWASDATVDDMVMRSKNGKAILFSVDNGVTTAVRIRDNDLHTRTLQVGPLTQAGTGNSSTWTANIRPFDAGKRGLHIQGQVSQTAELLLASNSANTTVAAITATGNVQGTGAYTTLSDEAVKENVTDLQLDPVDVVRQLRPVHFDYIDGEVDQVGFVAQEVAQVLPHAVVPFDTDDDGQPDPGGRLGLRADAITAYLVGAVQQLAAKVDELTSQLAAVTA